MHELGIADAICKTVTRIVGENGVEHLRSVTVEVGDLSGVVPRFLLDCWEAVTAGSALAGCCCTPCRPRPDARIAAVYL